MFKVGRMTENSSTFVELTNLVDQSIDYKLYEYNAAASRYGEANCIIIKMLMLSKLIKKIFNTTVARGQRRVVYQI